MGRHMDLKTPEEFALEILGTAQQQHKRWLEDQIRWRQRLVDQYTVELTALRKTLLGVVEAEATATAEIDPEQTQEFTAPDMQPEPGGEEESEDAKPGAPTPGRPKRATGRPKRPAQGDA